MNFILAATETFPLDQTRIDFDDLVTSIITLGLVAVAWLGWRGLKSVQEKEAHVEDKENGLEKQFREHKLDTEHRLTRLETRARLDDSEH